MREGGRKGARRKNTEGNRERKEDGGHEERRPRLATEKAKLPASANWFSGISRLQVVVGENSDNNDGEEEEEEEEDNDDDDDDR